jgi:polyphosphate kinase 2
MVPAPVAERWMSTGPSMRRPSTSALREEPPMSKTKHKKHAHARDNGETTAGGLVQDTSDGNGDRPAPAKMTTKTYERELRRLHGELVALQESVKSSGEKVCIVFEGRDTAGKGGTIKAITERVSPRVFRLVALPAPTERERSQMYLQRYVAHFPAAGEVVIFDRSWYNRAGVERVMGFCTPAETDRFLELTPAFEKAMVDSGIRLIKYWLEVSPQEQTRRLRSRIDDPRKVWKLTDMDLRSYGRWDDYSRARDAMLAATDTPWAPWFVARTDDKRRGRLNIITHLLSVLPYEPLERDDVELPKRQAADGYVEPPLRGQFIPTPF